MKVIIAARLSRKVADRDQNGLDTQERQAVDWARRNGHEIIAVCADFAKGRTDMIQRKNLRPWIEDPSKLVEYDAIACLKLDRLTRGNAAETRRLEDWADKHGKKLIIVDGPVFPAEGMDGAMWDLLKRQAHQEWLNTSERYQRNQGEIRNRGSWLGKPFYGYSIVKLDDKKTLIPNEHAETVKRIFTWTAASGASTQIAETLKLEAVKPPGTNWSATAVIRIIRNTGYQGRHANNPNLEYEAIIDSELWARANTALDARKPAKPRGHQRALLIPVCMQCGAKMYRSFIGGTASNNPRTTWYRCVAKCGARMIPCSQLDDEISELWLVDESPDTVKVYHPAEQVDLSMLQKRLRDAQTAQNWLLVAEIARELEEASQQPVRDAWTEDKPTGMSKAEAWTSLDADGRAAKMRGYVVTARRTEHGDLEWSITGKG